MSDRPEQLTLAVARRAVAEADAHQLGAVAAHARLQLARAAAREGECVEALTAAVDAIPGLAVSAELADAGLVLRWQGDPALAFLGLSVDSRERGERRAWVEAGIDALASVIDRVTAERSMPAALSGALDELPERRWVQGSARWTGVLAYLKPILWGIVYRVHRGAVRRLDDEPDVAIWETLAGALDIRRTVVQRYADSLGVLVSLSTGGADYRPLRQAVGRALLYVWRRNITEDPFLFRQPSLRRDLLEEVAPAVQEGDLAGTARAFKIIADGVAVTLPWELDAWLSAPFEGIQSTDVREE